MSQSLHITIVGAGASGTVLAINLLKDISFPATILLAERSATAVNRGVAYSSKLPYEPLNVPAGKMSILPESPDDFYDFVIQQKDAQATKETFVSRRWFGDYLTQRFKDAIQSKHKEVVCTCQTAEVTNIAQGAKKTFGVFAGDTLLTETDIVVLATGNEAPQQFKVTGNPPQGNYYDNPWRVETANIAADKDVLIIGTGLTMIDIAGSLCTAKHQGKVTAVSRNGKLPRVHTASANARALPLKENETLASLFELVRNEIKTQQPKNIHWSRVIDMLRPHTVGLWQQLSNGDKTIFLKRLRSFWEIHRHRMPPASKRLLDTLTQEGKLNIQAAGIKAIEWNDATQQFTVTATNKYKEQVQLTAHYVINCTGPATNYTQTQNELFRNLLQQQYITPDAHGLGILTQPNGRLTGNAKNLYAMGPLRKASEWESTAMREVVQQAKQLASEIIAAHPDMDALISELKKLKPEQTNLTSLQQIINQIDPRKLNYASLLPQEHHADYKRIKLLTGAIECSLIYWTPGGASAINQLNGYEGIALVLEGSVYESKYRYKDKTLTELQSNLYAAGNTIFEKKDEIYRIENSHASKPAVSLHIYIAPPTSFAGTIVFDEKRKKLGVLAAEAEIISWNQPATAFESIEANAFSFEPLLEFMI